MVCLSLSSSLSCSMFLSHASVEIECRCKKTYHTVDYMTPPFLGNGVIFTDVCTYTCSKHRCTNKKQQQQQQNYRTRSSRWKGSNLVFRILSTHAHKHNTIWWESERGRGCEQEKQFTSVCWPSCEGEMKWEMGRRGGRRGSWRLNRCSCSSESMSGITAVSHAQIHTAWNTHRHMRAQRTCG